MEDTLDPVKEIFEEIRQYAKENNVTIEQHDFPRELKIGYMASDGKTWKISLNNLKNSSFAEFFSTEAGKQMILDRMNGVI